MNGMFSSCWDLTSLDLSHFDTRSVGFIDGMFRSCGVLKSLNLSYFNLDNLNNIQNMFSGCNSLTTLRLDYCSKATISNIITSSNFPTRVITDSEGNIITRKIHCKKAYAAELKELLPSGWEFV
jgi:surface protein